MKQFGNTLMLIHTRPYIFVHFVGYRNDRITNRITEIMETLRRLKVLCNQMLVCCHGVSRDSLVVALGDCLTSIFGGVVIFAILGYMAHELRVPIDEVATQGKHSLLHPLLLLYLHFLSPLSSFSSRKAAPPFVVSFRYQVLKRGTATQDKCNKPDLVRCTSDLQCNSCVRLRLTKVSRTYNLLLCLA